MNPEIEKLIEFALADGVITDKEREVIRKKAEKLGEDPDEAEMILDAKLVMKDKNISDDNLKNSKEIVTENNEAKDSDGCAALISVIVGLIGIGIGLYFLFG